MDQLDSGTLQFSGKARRRRQQHRLRADLFISLRYLFNYDSILPLWRDFELFGRFLDGLPFIGGLDGAEMFGALANNIDAPAGHLTVGKLKQAQCFLVCDRHRRDCLRLESHSFENAVDGQGAPICRREHNAVSQPLGWSSRQAATLLEFYQNAFGVLTHWAFERAPVLAGRFGLNASEHHLGAAL